MEKVGADEDQVRNAVQLIERGSLNVSGAGRCRRGGDRANKDISVQWAYEDWPVRDQEVA